MIPHYTPYYFDEPDWDQMEEDWEMDKQEVDLSIAYHDATRAAEGYRVRTTRTQDRLDKLLEYHRKYFQQQDHSVFPATLRASDTPVEVTSAQESDRTERPNVDKKRGNYRAERSKVNRKRNGRKIDGRKVWLLREDKLLDQGELAERAGVSQVTISEIERGLRPFPQPRTIFALANALGVAPEDLATRD
jgi:DNA-binding XRE family transcriptional regulator